MLDFQRLTDWVIEVVETLGYPGVALLVALENVFPPIPSEIVLGLAGFVASRGDALLPLMIIAATVGSLMGAWILYGVAAFIGRDRVRAILHRYERWIRITQEDLDRAEGWFDRHQNRAVLFCRCIPLVRSLISLPAGYHRMSPVSFTAYTTLGSLVWNTIFVTAGYMLGERWEQVEEWTTYPQYIVLALIALGVAFFAWKRFLAPYINSHARHPD